MKKNPFFFYLQAIESHRIRDNYSAKSMGKKYLLFPTSIKQMDHYASLEKGLLRYGKRSQKCFF